MSALLNWEVVQMVKKGGTRKEKNMDVELNTSPIL